MGVFNWVSDPTAHVLTLRYRVKLRRLLRTSDSWVFSRTACLGNDLYQLAEFPFPRLNIQKGRVDELLRRHATEDRTWISSRYFDSLARSDIWPLIVEQEVGWWSARRAPEFVLMDSYSELTDQLFKDEVGATSFCANYSDIRTNHSAQQHLDCLGLLHTQDLYELYLSFFSLLHLQWPQSPIIFIHFPMHREERPKFIERAEVIRAAIERIASSDPMVVSLSLDEINQERCLSERAQVSDPFPYHYDAETYRTLAQELGEAVAALPGSLAGQRRRRSTTH